MTNAYQSPNIGMSWVSKQDQPRIEETYFKDIPVSVGFQARTVHEMFDDGRTLGYVMTECFKDHGIPHIWVAPEFRTAICLSAVTEIFHKLYVPTMRRMCVSKLITSCDIEDIGTTRFLQKLGFNIKGVIAADYSL